MTQNTSGLLRKLAVASLIAAGLFKCNLARKQQALPCLRGPQAFRNLRRRVDTFSTTKLWCSKDHLFDAGGTAPVGSFPNVASPYGCLDMAGNVWQWYADWHDDYDPHEARNPTGPRFGNARVLRGGSWYGYAASIFRTADRIGSVPGYTGNGNGFRCVQGPR